MARLLAVAHQTAQAGEFIDAVRAACEGDRIEVVLLVPATPVKHLTSWTHGESSAIAQQQAETAGRMLAEAGVEVIESRVGDPDPYEAIVQAIAKEDYDSLIVSTFPPGISRWLGADLINRLRRSIDVPITHVVAR